MRDVRLVGTEEDGRHLVLEADGEELRLPVDETLRSALREATQLARRAEDPDAPVREYTPREIQSMMRAGRSVAEVALESGWAPERVERYEAPILAERGHVAAMARAVVLRGRSSATTLEARVRARLQERGVAPQEAEWEAMRPEGGQWVVRLDFVAGDKPRQATWEFDLAARRLVAVDDEARWLGEDDAPAVPPSPSIIPVARPESRVFDVEAEGGLRHPSLRAADRPRTIPRRADGHSEPVDLMTAMRERSQSRRRRGRAGHAEEEPTMPPPLEDGSENQVLPVDGFAEEEARPEYDPEGLGYPPPASDRAGRSGGTLVTEADVDARTPRVRRPVELEDWDEADDAAPATAPEPTPAPVPEPEPEEEPEPADRPATRGSRKGARRSVPSWDDIMFGKKD